MPVLQELAVQLLWRQLEYPEWNKTFEPYWNSLPKWGTIYSKENWLIDPDHLALFQEPYLVIPLKKSDCCLGVVIYPYDIGRRSSSSKPIAV